MATRKKTTKRAAKASTSRKPPAKAKAKKATKTAKAAKSAKSAVAKATGIAATTIANAEAAGTRHIPDTGAPYKIEFAPAHDISKRPLSIKGVVAEGATETPSANLTDAATTAVYVHGIGNHPEEQVLVVRWDRALFGKDMGDRTRMAYWVNRARYPQPSSCDCIDPRCACHDPEEAIRSRKVLAVGDPDPEAELQEAVKAITSDTDQQAFLYDIGQRMIDEAKAEARREQVRQEEEGVSAAKGIYTSSVTGKGIGDALLRKLTDLVTSVALPDVQDFLFDEKHRKQMDDTFLARLSSGGGPFVVIAHSQGSMIAYDVLRQLPPDVKVKLFVTIGSPLGLPPVRAVFKKWTGQKLLPFPPCVERWVNLAVEGDVVALDPTLGDEIDNPGGRFEDLPRISREKRDENPLFEGNPHSSMGYLSTEEVQNEVYKAVGREFARSLGRQIITSDLVEKMESVPDDKRHPVLIQVREDKNRGDSSIAEGRERIDQRLRQLAQDRIGGQVERMKIQHHMRYVSAALSRTEIEVLRTESDDLQVLRMWQNASKKALICRSAHILHAAAAHQAYAAQGDTIEWAVLDTGVEHTHPHFQKHRNLASLWDCTRNDPATSTAIAEPHGGFLDYGLADPWQAIGANEFRDRAGHGTHVAGIIAGEWPNKLKDEDELLDFSGMAPSAKLHSFKVLDDRGRGQDAWILIALDKIARINENAQELRIHGINLSLGGNFDPSVYGCGHTPLCQELRRLWRQGVLIVMAAGNEGFTVLQTLEDGPWQANLDLSIGDPANLEEAIAVGSVHRVNPHTFGVSYFSSRGPTADGRRKPDVVAPGEKILSARADYDRMLPGLGKGPFTNEQLADFTAEQFYIAESGTSMAAPHVSGLLAAFLSQRREFIGYPDRVKRILTDNCTDLERDPYAQGAGLPNLMRMLQST